MHFVMDPVAMVYSNYRESTSFLLGRSTVDKQIELNANVSLNTCGR